MMSNATLYQVQANYTQFDSILNQLQQLCQTGDSIILLGESVLAVYQSQMIELSKICDISILECDMPILSGDKLHHVHILTDDEWANLILKYTRHMTLQ